MMSPASREKAARLLIDKYLTECAAHCARCAGAGDDKQTHAATIMQSYAAGIIEAQAELAEAKRLQQRPA